MGEFGHWSTKCQQPLKKVWKTPKGVMQMLSTQAILISIMHYILNIQMPLDLLLHPRLREIDLMQRMQHTHELCYNFSCWNNKIRCCDMVCRFWYHKTCRWTRLVYMFKTNSRRSMASHSSKWSQTMGARLRRNWGS